MQKQQALARQRLLTLCFEEMETVRMELEAVAREWTRPPPDAMFSLRIPVEYASLNAARLISGPYIYLTGEDSFQIAQMGVQGLRVEIVSDAPPPPEEPPPPPVLEMPATFNLELMPGQHVALDTTVASDELDMARMEDGTTVDGMFWGKLDIVHQGDTHKMEFSGTRLQNEQYTPEFMFDSRPTTARCHLSLLTPEVQYCDEQVADNKVKYFLRAHPGGAMEHFESEMVSTALYYEAIPEPGMMDPNDYIAPRNGYAMSFRDFVPHLMNVLDQLGMSLYARTNFINNNMGAFSAHKNIAYRFLPPPKIAAAIDIAVTSDPCVFLRLFLIWRGLSDDDVGIFAGAGEKEANTVNWRQIVGWTEESKDSTMFRVLETAVLEVT
ncbi:hypothetical protein EV421DRAFT_1888716 [Armillaria borealis]|uniref:Uncharacterized protein n=1 Tax=Armillaria borealis TaxID=47425 RepID=A0AA39K023_9AGAR|nr:hypothetical protein EV421DRAFT_1888716 [Armillaria borealis]